MKKIFKNVKVIQMTGIIECGTVVAEDGVITEIFSNAADTDEVGTDETGTDETCSEGDSIAEKGFVETNQKDAEIIDGEGLYLAPGLVDIHTHAGGDKEFVKDPIACAQHHLIHGTTTVCPAVYFNLNADQYVEAINLIKTASKKKEGRNIAGIYMEGPFLNPKYGADKEQNAWESVDPEQYMKVIDAAKGFARVYAIAPEREGIEQYVRDVRQSVTDAVFSVAHSEAAPEQVERFIPDGLKLGTHFSDATGKVNPWPDPEIVGVGPDEVVLMHDDMYAELIVDNCGVHVAPYLIRLVRKIKGDEHIILISDATASEASRPEAYKDCFDLNFDSTGELMGSNLTLDQACRNMMKHTGATVADVFKFAATNPARAVGFDDRGEIAVGKRADILLVDGQMNVKHIYIGGEQIK